MAIILALDTSSEACSCALSLNGRFFERFEVIPRQHASCLLPMVDDLLQEHGLELKDLDAIAVGRGPGSFTGLRIAVGAAQGLAFAAEVPLIPVSTLSALAWQVHSNNSHDADESLSLLQNNIFSCIDARINEVYWGVFQWQGGEPILLGDESLNLPEDIPVSALSESTQWLGAGSGMAFIDRMEASVQGKIPQSYEKIYPRAVDIVALAAIYYARGEYNKPEEVSPVYLRDKVTHN